MFLNNNWNISSVFPQQDGPQTAIKSLSLVDIILFIALDLEERSQLCTKAMKTKMLIPQNHVGKTQAWLKKQR